MVIRVAVTNFFSLTSVYFSIEMPHMWYRGTDQESEYVLPAIQLTLKKLQLDYLDLYLIHTPFSFRHGMDSTNMQEEDKLGYDEARIARVWEVSKGLTCTSYL